MANQPEPSPELRTFKLYDFNQAFSVDAHHYVFIQRESNSEALATFEENLREIMDGDPYAVRCISRVFTEIDIKNIQASCLEILQGFVGTNDAVTYSLVLGKIEVPPRGSEDIYEWFIEYFFRKDVYWNIGFNLKPEQVIDLETESFE